MNLVQFRSDKPETVFAPWWVYIIGEERLINIDFKKIASIILDKEKDGTLGSHGLEYPHYTRPEVLIYKNKKYKVPPVLLSGDHAKIEEWRGRAQPPRLSE